MPTISPTILPILMLFASNVFMTFAWYGHLKFKGSPLPLVVIASWGIAFFEYWLAVPANRWGSAVYSAAQLKTMQEVITLSRVRRILGAVSEGAAGLESLVGLCLDRRGSVFDLSQMDVIFRGRTLISPTAPPAISGPPNCRSATTARRPGPGARRGCVRGGFAAGVPPVTVSPSSVEPHQHLPASAPVNRLPVHFGNRLPV